jgi:hypothetical protein
MSDALDCPITVPERVSPGDYANAFRVVSTEDGVCVLDFVRYSEPTEKAVMVSRVRVRPAFLPRIRDKLDAAVRGAPHAHNPD